MGSGIIQIILVKWGSAYTAAHVNGLCAAIQKNTTSRLRFVCVTDDPAGLDAEIEVRDFPDFGVPFSVLIAPGYLAKISIFDKGILEPTQRALFFDLDTAVMGDVKVLADLLAAKRALYMLPNHFIRHWRIRTIIRLLNPRIYYFANSSVMAFYPEDYFDMAQELRARLPAALEYSKSSGQKRPRYFRVDDHFISDYARDSIRVFPGGLAARFQDSYMTFAFWMSALRDRLPWVVRSRKRRVALTFAGRQTKPDQLCRIEPGAEIIHGPLRTRWNYPELRKYWTNLALPYHDAVIAPRDEPDD